MATQWESHQLKKNQTTDVVSNTDGSQNQCAEWKKSLSKGYIYDDSIYRTFWKRQNYSGGQPVANRAVAAADWGGAGSDYEGSMMKF